MRAGIAGRRVGVARVVACRVVRARATNKNFIAGQMRHGPRGASEFAETVDRLIGFAETTEAIPGALIGAVHDAYLGDADVRAFILRENPAAAIAIVRIVIVPSPVCESLSRLSLRRPAEHRRR